MMRKTTIGTTAVAGLVLVAAIAGCSGGSGKSSAAKGAATCSDYEHVVTLDNSDAGGSAALYTQMRDLYRNLQKEAPNSLDSDLKVLSDDEQQLAENGTDSSSQNDAAQAAANHVDVVLGPMCGGTVPNSSPSPAVGGDQSYQPSTDGTPGIDECQNLRKYVGDDNPVTSGECANDDGDGSDTMP